MAIKRMTEEKENKFDHIAEELARQETEEQKKNKKVIEKISGSGNAKTRTIEVKSKDGKISMREIKVTEKRKTLPVYIPETMYKQFDAINTAYGKSNNSAIVELIKDYVMSKKDILSQLP